MQHKGSGTAEEVVASGEALSTVAQLLGIRDSSSIFEGDKDDDPPARPAGLGLGARFLPHHKAMALVSGVDKRLGKRLQGSAGASANWNGGPGQGPGSSIGKGSKHGRAAPPESSDDEGEDLGRASAFKKVKPSPAPLHKHAFLDMPGSKKGSKKKKTGKDGLAMQQGEGEGAAQRQQGQQQQQHRPAE